MRETGPTRSQSDLAEMLELLLDKGVVINADIAVTVGETELLGVKLRAAIASFETAAKYGLEFPEGTDMKRVEDAAGVEELAEEETVPVESGGGSSEANDDGENDEEAEEASEADEDAEKAEAKHDGD
ncbi:gas vesicle protein GvpJ [Haladaptatus caseinilyticus]|uniref:gas vesicle protein GvpJ n=1 Tax=Haladaptatus caseinilyticus TaxID=2993314 RepID=UPI00224A9B92|nr:gas vesicle protein [Haladaptatus caseinilyticus]